MKIIATSSLKGGVGKTTTNVFLARALAYGGDRVLAVDLDHNNNLTDYWLNQESAEGIEARNVYHVLTRALGLEAGIWRWPDTAPLLGVDILPATPTLARVGVELARDPGAALRFRAALRKLDYDFILIDTPPSLSLELIIGLYAADVVLVPLSASRWTIQGYKIIAEEAAKVGEAGLQAPMVLAVPSMVSPTTEAALRKVDAWTLTKTAIYRDPAIGGAVDAGRWLKAGTKAAGWFMDLAEEVS